MCVCQHAITCMYFDAPVCMCIDIYSLYIYIYTIQHTKQHKATYDHMLYASVLYNTCILYTACFCYTASWCRVLLAPPHKMSRQSDRWSSTMAAKELSMRPMGTNGGAEVITVPSPRPFSFWVLGLGGHRGSSHNKVGCRTSAGVSAVAS